MNKVPVGTRSITASLLPLDSNFIESASVEIPDTFRVPSTSSFAVGCVEPIPILPSEFTRILSVKFVCTVIGSAPTVLFLKHQGLHHIRLKHHYQCQIVLVYYHLT